MALQAVRMSALALTLKSVLQLVVEKLVLAMNIKLRHSPMLILKRPI